MQFVVERNSFLKDLLRVTGVIEPRNTIPVCNNVRIDAGAGGLILRATNMSMEAELSCDARVIQQGLTTANGKLLTDFVKRCEDGSQIAATLDESASQLKLVSGRTRSVLPVLPADLFPVFPQPTGETLRMFSVPSDVLKEIVARVAFAVSSDEHRPFLQGVFAHQDGNELLFAATDGYRLTRMGIPLPDGADGFEEIIIPKPFLNEMSRSLMDETSSISATDRFVSVTSGDFRLISSLIGYRYPDYQRAWPMITGLSVEFDRAALIRSIQRVAIVTDQTQMGVQLTVGPNEIRLASQSKDRGACFDAIDATANGSTVSSFNHKYLLDVLGAFDCERLCAHFNEAEGFPLRFAEADDPESRNSMGIMPLRISQITEERNAA